jgi:hypothetical protein
VPTLRGRPGWAGGYPSDLSGPEWAVIEPLLPAACPRGRPLMPARRVIVNAILYVNRTGQAAAVEPGPQLHPHPAVLG